MSETQTFNAPNLDLNHLATALLNWYRVQNFNVQQIDMQEGGILVQASKGGWRNAVGMASALNVIMHQSEASLTIEIGAGKWLDKAAVGAASMLVLWPLALVAAYGAWQQSQLPKRTFEFVQQYVYSRVNAGTAATDMMPPVDNAVAAIPMPATSILLSEQPSVPATADTTSPIAALRFCPACGTTVSETDRFCASCGNALT